MDCLSNSCSSLKTGTGTMSTLSFFTQMLFHCVHHSSYDIIFSIDPGTPYQVSVVAFTSVGMGVLGDYIVFFSEELTPTKAPDNIKVNFISDTSINVTWTPLSLFEAQGFPKYRITLLSATENRQRRQFNPISVTTTNTFAVFDNLDTSAKYSVEVGVTTGETNDVINSEYVEGM